MAVKVLGSRLHVGRLSVGALGLALVLLVSAAWASGVLYLLPRLGGSSPVRLGRVEGVHVYAGLVAGVFLLAKVLRVGLRSRVPGVPYLLLWQRWISWSLLALYATILVTGILVLLPIHGSLLGALAEIHLQASIWALPPTAWHVWHYRRRILPYVTRLGRVGLRWRFWIGIAAVAPAAVGFVFLPRAASQLPALGGGHNWAQGGMPGTPIEAITTTADGATLVAGGSDRLHLSRDGTTWRTVPLPRSGGAAPMVRSLAPWEGGVLVGTDRGLFVAGLGGAPPAVLLGDDVRAVAVDPTNRRLIALSSAAGPVVSWDGGSVWQTACAGLHRPASASAITFFGGAAYVSDGTGVFELRPGAAAWRQVSAQASVAVLTVSAGRDRLYATSPQAIRVLWAGRWASLAPPAPAQRTNGMARTSGTPGGVLAVGPRLYVPGTVDGVSASADGGQTWTQLGGGIRGAPSRLVDFRGALWAATREGLYRYRLAPEVPATPQWWALLLAAALGAGVLGTVVATPDRLPLDRLWPARRPGRAGLPAAPPAPAPSPAIERERRTSPMAETPAAAVLDRRTAVELLCHLAASAELCVTEPAPYGTFHLLDSVSRLSSALLECGLDDPWLAELRQEIDLKKTWMMSNHRDAYFAMLPEISVRLAQHLCDLDGRPEVAT